MTCLLAVIGGSVVSVIALWYRRLWQVYDINSERRFERKVTLQNVSEYIKGIYYQSMSSMIPIYIVISIGTYVDDFQPRYNLHIFNDFDVTL